MDRPVVCNAELLASALEGLRATPKRLDPRWFYDAAGSALFEQITRLPEYYPTRTETAILRDRVGEIAVHVPERAVLVELGSGASVKSRILLDALDTLVAYVPVDVSEELLGTVARALSRDYPELEVVPIVDDFLAPLELPPHLAERDKVGFFPGSTIGNLAPGDAAGLLRRVRAWAGVAAFVVGIDLVKDRGTLIRAYDDEAGVTAAFNRNALVRLNREAGAEFDPDAFAHEARWNEAEGRVEMHLVSRRRQRVRVGPEDIWFAEGESIHTENSHKYTRAGFADLAGKGGWTVGAFLTDADEAFAVVVLEPAR